jgi:hypothetical protein
MSDPTVQVPWHFGSLESMAPYLSELTGSFDSSLPLVDFGCGDGVLTEHLAGHFDVVVGTDISGAAVAKAQRDNKGSKVSYEQLDGTDTVGAKHLHARLGDANVHLRGVLHAMMPADWPHALTSLAILAGQKGRVFDIEISSEFSQALQGTVDRFGKWYAGMRRGQGCGLVPHEFSTTGLANLYRSRGWSIQSVGELTGRSQLQLPDGSFFIYPFSYVVATRDPSRL